MATRDKKARSVTADSPTPSLGSANSGSSGNISALAISSSSTGAASGNDSAPTTPTSTRKAAAVASTVAAAGGGSSSSGGSGSTNTSSTRGSLSRLKSKQQLLQQGGGADEGAVDELAGIESIAVAATTTTTPSRTTRGGSALLREDSAGRESPAAKDDTTATTTTTTAGPGGASKDLTKSPAIGARRAAATATTTATTATTTSSKPAATAQSNKKRVVTLKRAGLLKRKGKKIIGKPMLGRKVEARRQLVTAAKSTGTRGAAATVKDVLAASKEKEEETTAATTPSLRNGKPRNSDSPVAKRKAVLKQQEAAGSSSKSPDSGSMERRRSGSVLTEDGAEQTVAEMKRELLDYESRSKMLDKMAEAFNERKAAGGGAASPVVEKGTLRRSMRQRKSTAREELAPPARGKSVGGGGGTVEIKLEPAESLESLAVEGTEQDSSTAAVSVDAPLTIDTTVATVDGGVACEPLHSDGTTVSSLGGVSSGGVIAGASGTAGEEVELGSVVGIGGGSAGGSGKDPSLSPGELVSEGVSEQSVKECYSEPAFLENNLGIEKDPKLGEIVQGRFRCDKVSDDAEDNAKSETVGDNAASDNGEEGGVGGSATKDADQEVEEEETVAHEAREGVETVQKVKQEVQEDTASVGEDREITIEGVKVEEEPMEQDEEEEEEIGKELPVEEKMDITEEEVMECVKIKEEPEEDVAAVVLEEAKGDGDTSSKTDHVPAKDANEAQESNRRPDSAGSAVDEEAGASRASSAGGAVVAPSDGEVSSSSTTSKTPTDDASSPVPVASVPCKANGDSNGTTTGDQSTPNQQSSRTGGQQRPSTGATPKTASKSSSTPVAAAATAASTAGTLSPATGKESKPKTRTTKEKSKEDEKTREEKLRQEKLRVEEKVREEKQRAERLEAERRLKEEQQQQQQHQQQVLENGHEEEQPSPASGSGGPQDEQEHKTDTTPVPALLALGGLNLPAITIALTSKKDGGSSDEKEEAAIVPKKCELEILPIKADGGPPPAVVLLSKEEKPAKEGGAAAAAPSLADTAESRLRTASKGENAAAALSAVAERKDSSNKSSSSPLTVLKQGTSNGSPSPPPATGKDAASTTTTTTPPDESDDAAKASHLLNLGLLTIRAADEEKQRRAEQKPSSSADGGAQDGGTGSNSGSQSTTGKGSDGWLAAGTAHSGGGSGRAGNKSTRSSKDEYTVSMKTTVLKGGSGSGGGSRGEKRKQQRMPLKMTFQKGKGKGGGRESSNGSGSVSSNGSGYATDTGNNGDNTFYTVHSNELDHHSSNSSDGHSHRDAAGGRKAHSRSHTTDGVNLTEAVGESVSSKEVSQKSLVIPEKASSFNVHPERLCRDQCSYCGGKFGLYDTPCHVAAIKSTERQQRILLATLPKITLDSCLCDACYRHVDRKANCPPQKKKSSTVSQTSASTGAASSSSSSTTSTSTTNNNSTATQSTVSPLVLKVTTNKDGSTSIATEQPATAMEDGPTAGGKAREICAVRQCTAHAMQSLRRKWMVKMKRKIGKQLDINLEQAAKATAEYISICNKHYEQISHLMICAMCTKPLQRNHVYHLYNNVPQLERLIQEQGISMRLSSSELVVCKLCKYYANLLIKPPEPKTKKAQFVNDYNRRLLCRQRAAEEQREQQAEAAVTVTAVAPAAVPRQRQPMPVTDIVISDGDEEEEEAEDEEVEETTITESQSQQHPLPARYQTLGDIFSIGDSSVSVRRRVSSRKSPDVTIVESNGATQMSELEEISIIPTSKSLSALHQQQQQQQQSRDDNIDMTQVLKSNPNISMRELFPGEEELGVHVNIPFSSSSMRTPEGWTKVQSTIQYDDSTRALWEELQKPYGNQSSFLRHLLLLEKYFRNGDLVLSPQAKTSATTYSEAVQNRLRSYDNVPSVVPSSPPALASLTPAATAPTVAADKTSHIFQQFSSATITIVPANKVRPRTSAGGGSSSAEITPVSPPAPVSLLKSNNLHLANSGDQGATKQSLKRKLSIESGGRTSGGASAITSPLNSSSTVGGGSTKVVRLDEPKAPLSSPPELISISNRKASVTITTIPPAAAQLATVGSPPAAANATAQKQLSLLQQPQQSLLQSVAAVDAVTAAAATLLAKKSPTAGATATTANTPTGPSSTGTTGSANASATTTAREIIQMPEQLTEAERRESSTRPWRPTLLPIAPGVSESLKTGPLYQTADGRTLPKLVQVMSGGKPYHISIEDYNRMCILRREKLLQQQQNMMQQQQQQQQQQTVANKRQSQLPQPNKQPSAAATTLPPPPALRLASTAGSVENNNGSANSVAVSVASSAKVVQLPNQLLEQNSLIPILSGSSGANKMGNVQKNSSLTVTMTTTVNNNSLAKSSSSSSSSSSATATVPPSMKPLSLPNSTTVYPMLMSANTLSLPSLFATSSAGSLPVSSVAALFSEVNAAMTQTSSPSHRPAPAATSLVLGQPTSLLTTTTSSSSSSASAATAAVLNPFEHLFKDGNKVTQAQLQEFVAIATAANGGGSSSLLDNSSPAQLLSKIPKSLTVIPQQKQRSMSRVSSHEDQNSA